MKQYIPYVLIGAGIVVIIIGGIGAPDGVGGVMPREFGARLVGGVLILFGAGWFGYDFYHARRRKQGKP